jgi:histidinol-phosphate aminotransferase
VIAVVTPNNPTGLVARADDLEVLSRAAPGALLIVDLAYTEFADRDLTEVALALPNAVVIRTLSKAWGLAGARVGYAAGPKEVIAWMRAAGGPYAVSAVSLEIARRRLTMGDDGVRRFVDRIRFERGQLRKVLLSCGARVLESQANFVLARVSDAPGVRERLAQRGIAVRAFGARAGLEDALRITCPGNERDFERVCEAVKEAIST